MKRGIFTWMLVSSLAILTVGVCEAAERPADAIPAASAKTEPKAMDLGPGPVDLSEPPKKGPETERWYFTDWHEPYDAVLDRDHLDAIWEDVKSVPDERSIRIPQNSWSQVGPLFMNTPAGGQYTGRVLDLGLRDTLTLAAATGGLWDFFILIIIPIPVSLSSGIDSLAASTFDTHPTDDNTILLGTGEPYQRTGTGLYRTTNEGATWTPIPMSPQPSGFFRVRWADNGVAHAATTSGYYRSTNGGLTWTRTLTGTVTDLAITPADNSILYAPRDGFGLYKSTNSGSSWTLLGGGLPTSNIGRGAVAVGTNIPGRVYVAYENSSTSGLLGVYKSDNSGTSWSNVSPANNYMGGQGWYDNMITVDPNFSGTVFVGGVTLWRTDNYGANWTQVTSDHLHVDYHAAMWGSDNTKLWLGHDGGWSYSPDNGVTWQSSGNIAPITQYYNIDVEPLDANVYGGGAQDNGLSVTYDGGTNFDFVAGGDGSGFAIDPGNEDHIYAVNGLYGGALAWRRLKTTDQGTNWTHINTGITASSNWAAQIRHDQVPSVFLYTNADQYVYQSTDRVNWTKLNASAFPATVRQVNVARYQLGVGPLVYACLSSSTTGNRLRVYDDTTWYSNRDSGLPAGRSIRAVIPHATDRNVAYALMNGLGNAGQKIYKTSNRGQTWTNVSGNLPDVPMGSMVPHPTNSNQLYVGSEFGAFRTLDGGGTWHRWNDGMPEAVIITEMGYTDKGPDGFFIVAGTYGRSIFERNIAGGDNSIFADGFESGNTSAW